MTASPATAAGRRRTAMLDAESGQLFELYAATRDVHIRDELVSRHRWLALACARQMRRRSEPLDELEQVALIGIFKAVERFDPAHGVQFRTYASVTALGELRRHYRDCGWTLRVPRSVKERYLRVQHALGELTATLGHSPTNAEIATWLGISVEDVIEALEIGGAMRPETLLATTVATRGGSVHDDPVMDDCVRELDDRHEIARLMRALDPQKQRVVKLRFFAHMTQQEIADTVGVSQVQISRLLRAAITQMRDLAAPLAAAG